jgi:hypothetical protein
MKTRITLALGAALLMGVPGLAYGSSGSTNANPNSATKFAPGQIQKRSGGTIDAQDVAPGQVQKRSGGAISAQDRAPGQRKKEPVKTGTTKRLNQ